MGNNQDGRLEVFVIGVDERIYHIWQTAPSNGWSNWNVMGSALDTARAIAVGNNQDGRLEVFIIGVDGFVHHIWQTAPNDGWSFWNRLGISPPDARDIAVGRNADGRLEVFLIGGDERIYHIWQTSPNNGWSDWSLLGHPDNKAKKIVVANNQDGRLEVFTIGTNDTLYHFWQTAPNNGWSGEHAMPYSLAINLILVGTESFTTADRQEIAAALDIMREIYSRVDILVERVGWFGINNADAGGFVTIDSKAEAKNLTESWAVPNDSLDVFVVRSMTYGADGVSPVNGTCNKNAEGWTGAVVSLNGDAANSGNTFAHEVGHYLSLNHVPDTGNFVGSTTDTNGASDSWTGIFDWQGNAMKGHCFIHK